MAEIETEIQRFVTALGKGRLSAERLRVWGSRQADGAGAPGVQVLIAALEAIVKKNVLDMRQEVV